MTTRMIATKFPGHGGDHRSLTSKLNVAFGVPFKNSNEPPHLFKRQMHVPEINKLKKKNVSPYMVMLELRVAEKVTSNKIFHISRKVDQC